MLDLEKIKVDDIYKFDPVDKEKLDMFLLEIEKINKRLEERKNGRSKFDRVTA